MTCYPAKPSTCYGYLFNQGWSVNNEFKFSNQKRPIFSILFHRLLQNSKKKFYYIKYVKLLGFGYRNG